jgi:hypothetical protein
VQIMLGLLPRALGLMLLLEILILGQLEGSKTLIKQPVQIIIPLEGSKTMIKQPVQIIIQKQLPLQRKLKIQVALK